VTILPHLLFVVLEVVLNCIVLSFGDESVESLHRVPLGQLSPVYLEGIEVLHDRSNGETPFEDGGTLLTYGSVKGQKVESDHRVNKHI